MKFMMTVNGRNIQSIQREAVLRSISIQELIRAVIIPEWLMAQKPTPQPLAVPAR